MWKSAMLVCIFGLCLLTQEAKAQGNPLNQSVNQGSRSRAKHLKGRGFNLPDFDNRPIHYGFFLALNYSSFSLKHSALFVQGGQGPPGKPAFQSINPIGGPGFTTGFILNARLHEVLDLRILPTVAFYSRYVEFTYQGIPDSVDNQLNQSTYAFLELPFLIKYKSQRRHNTRMYMIGGIKPSVEVGAKRDEIGNSYLRVNSSDLTLEYGFGFDFYYPLFKLSPEIRFSYGINGMKYPDDNAYANNIRNFYTRTVTLYLNFE
ncbi:MAG: porin family protein [Bacteroidota bacterium]